MASSSLSDGGVGLALYSVRAIVFKCDDIEGRRVPLTPPAAPLGISDAPLRPGISDTFQQIAAVFALLVVEPDECLLQCRRKKVSPLVGRDGMIALQLR